MWSFYSLVLWTPLTGSSFSNRVQHNGTLSPNREVCVHNGVSSRGSTIWGGGRYNFHEFHNYGAIFFPCTRTGWTDSPHNCEPEWPWSYHWGAPQERCKCESSGRGEDSNAVSVHPVWHRVLRTVKLASTHIFLVQCTHKCNNMYTAGYTITGSCVNVVLPNQKLLTVHMYAGIHIYLAITG